VASVYIALGANIGDRLANLRRAIDLIGASDASTAPITSTIKILRLSPLYESAPVGVTDQPAFLNAVLLAQTDLESLPLLDALQAIEHTIGRRPGRRWGPRPIDLDILTYDDQRIDTERLTVPHPRLTERGFVLQPLADLDPGLILSGQEKPVSDLLAGIDTSDLVVVNGPTWAD
jgi:2-amino-4-hydroxy-6-hydroxymethyldihydropteridine diphosphokinase